LGCSSYSLVQVCRRFRGTCSLHFYGHRNEHLWNARKHLPDCTAQYPLRQPSSCLLWWKLQIWPVFIFSFLPLLFPACQYIFQIVRKMRNVSFICYNKWKNFADAFTPVGPAVLFLFAIDLCTPIRLFFSSEAKQNSLALTLPEETLVTVFVNLLY
jgi:hypothetical protein